MSNGQKYVGKADNAKSNQSNGKKATQEAASVTQTATPADQPTAADELTPEDFTRFGRDILKNQKPNLSFSLDILNNGRYGNSHATVLLWALRNHQDLLQKEALSSLKHEEFENAYDWFGELECCNALLFDVALGLGGLAEKNYWASHNTSHEAYTKDVANTAQQKKRSYEKFLSEVVGLSPEDAESVEDYNRVQARKSLLNQTPESGWNADEFREKLEHLPLGMLKGLLAECKAGGSCGDPEQALIIDEVLKRIADL